MRKQYKRGRKNKSQKNQNIKDNVMQTRAFQINGNFLQESIMMAYFCHHL